MQQLHKKLICQTPNPDLWTVAYAAAATVGLAIHADWVGTTQIFFHPPIHPPPFTYMRFQLMIFCAKNDKILDFCGISSWPMWTCVWGCWCWYITQKKRRESWVGSGRERNREVRKKGIVITVHIWYSGSCQSCYCYVSSIMSIFHCGSTSK